MDTGCIVGLRYLLFFFCLLPAIVMTPPAFAAGGDIIIIREVQPRSATRPPLVPDPNPHIVNPKPNAVIDQGLSNLTAPGELSDSDFANITGGHGIQHHLTNPQGPHAVGEHVQHGSAGVNQQNIPASPGASHIGGSRLGNNIDGQVNRSLQQGLSPLQQLQGR